MVSIVIVNFNGGELLLRCVESIKKQTFRDYEIIIVDNNSTDKSKNLLDQDDSIRMIINSTNAGFAKAQNQGIDLSQGQYVMTMNFDLQLDPEFLSQAVKALDSYKNVGTISGKMLRMEYDGTKTDVIDNTGLLLSRKKIPILRGQGELDQGQYKNMDYVFGAMGAAAVHKKHMLENIKFNNQYFDEKYFMWYEDVDLDWRSRIYGWDCMYIPEAVCYHIGDPQGHRERQYATKLSIRNRWFMILSNDKIYRLIKDAIWMAKEEIAIFFYVLRKKRLRAYLFAVIELFTNLPYIVNKRNIIQQSAIRPTPVDYPKSINDRDS